MRKFNTGMGVQGAAKYFAKESPMNILFDTIFIMEILSVTNLTMKALAQKINYVMDVFLAVYQI